VTKKVILSILSEQIKITVEKIKDYYKNKNIQNAAIDIYWYGGEPTTMGVKMFSGMCDIINNKLRQQFKFSYFEQVKLNKKNRSKKMSKK
jgi:sulfatase maturation enzyme AslB (radical SAM superfamily)